jgi:DivIVA domain-containing protein
LLVRARSAGLAESYAARGPRLGISHRPARLEVECHTDRVPDVGFTIVLRGYDIDQVNDLIRRANRVLGSADPAARVEMQGELRQPDLRTRIRGYDRSQVDQALARLADQLTAR